MFVHSGLIDAAGDGRELIGVMSHELAHVTQRHGVKKLVSSQLTQFLLFAVISLVAGDMGLGYDLQRTLIRSAGSLLNLSYSRG